MSNVVIFVRSEMANQVSVCIALIMVIGVLKSKFALYVG
jgi:hypothetical protein